MSGLKLNNWKDHIFDVSIDKLTIVGDVDKRMFEILQSKCSILPEFDLLQGGYYPKIMVIGKVFVELNTNSKAVKKKREFRMELNPNNVTEEEIQFLNKELLQYVKNASLTRIDVAFDTSWDLSEYTYIQTMPQKRSQFFGRSGSLETMYFGTNNSLKQFRIYNKKKQLQDEKNIEVEEIPVWWRFEIVLRREENTTMLHATRENENPFQDIQILKPDYMKCENWQDRAMVLFLKEHPEQLGELNYRQKKKYKEILMKISDEDITEFFIEAYKTKRSDLWHKVTKFTERTKNLFK